MTKPPPQDMALVTVTGDEAPSLEGAARQLGVGVEDLDVQFGVVPIDPRKNLYAVQVRADRLPRGFEESEPYRGPYSSPEIAPLGPVGETEEKKK